MSLAASFHLLGFNHSQIKLDDRSFFEKNKAILAYPQYLRGKIPLSDATIDSVVKFYCEDGISRTSSNSKDTIKINGQPVAVGFLEMTVFDGYRIFNE
ncbi:unnamed protein product [Rotaria magnacalcarata]|uniref:Uncharacterized protein n=1 Tax=Rotaria magnacalcarata TaxID=392030 RepID=A0A814G0X8_9BILA|nr:unnamed protein product [Rotaria magnacalcarata]CAF2029688.1 unnamed protein product [Rotaria magnacalcarata]CAF2248151.1 unnamed protein product [Rotaria magnacalcarata]CAF3837446.1 unnamed protein product [Rotaria magnacalcarata]CAF4077934.1 unnamed protein product [Rotaria magnacalcarata]